jgi:hypothetical protein
MADLSLYTQGVLEGAAVQTAELNLIALLKPKLSVDGDAYCWLLGENIQDGVAGFGPSPYLAALDFNRAFHEPLPAANGSPTHDR